MRVQADKRARFSQEEQVLIEQVRQAVREESLELKDNRGGAHACMSVGVYVFNNPLRIDFEISSDDDVRNDMQGSFIGPQLGLTPDIFENGSLKPDVLRQVSEAFDHFAQYWQTESI